MGEMDVLRRCETCGCETVHVLAPSLTKGFCTMCGKRLSDAACEEMQQML